MLFAIDIDGTIAGRNMQQFAHTCNERFQLKLSNIEGLNYRAFMQLPEIQAYQQCAGKEAFGEALYQIEQEPEMLSVLPTMLNTLQGISKLATFGHIGYYTVRKGEEAQIVTRQWLEQQQFPSADNVNFCMSLMNKLVQLYFYIEKTQEQVALIDDMYEMLLSAYANLVAGSHPKFDTTACHKVAETLHDHLRLVAFRAKTLPEACHGLRVHILPSWTDEHVDILINELCSAEPVSSPHI